MAIIRPFNALRPVKEKAHLVASVPYDVVNREEAKQLAEDNELSYLHVTRAEIDLDSDVDAYSPEVYQKAKENLQKLIEKAPMKTDDDPHFYLYKLKMGDRSQVGITATFSVDDYDNDVILKHEKTRKVKEDDRTNHIVTTEAQTGVVFLTYRGVDKINDIVEKAMNENDPVYDLTAQDGVVHTIWVLPDEHNQTIIDEMNKVNKLYIADGHHRAASAGRSRKVMQERNPDHTGNEEYNYFIATLFPAEQLEILPYNRVVFDLKGNSNDEFLNLIGEKFKVEKTGEKEPKERKVFCMYLDGDWYTLKPRDSVMASNTLSDSVAETLDVSILQNFLLNPVLGIEDPRTDDNIDFIGGIRGTEELERLVDSGKAKVAFSLYPVSVDDLMNISDAGEIMPPKSTWFEPKLRDGFLTHLI